MKYYLCNEKGVGTDHNCSSVKFVNGIQVCGYPQFFFDYAGHMFCANAYGTKEIDETQGSFSFNSEGET